MTKEAEALACDGDEREYGDHIVREYNRLLRPLLRALQAAILATATAPALIACGCDSPVGSPGDAGPDVSDAGACVGGPWCAGSPVHLSVGDEPNREFPRGPAALAAIGDHVLGAAHIAGRRGEGSPGETVVFRYDVSAGVYELVDRRTDGIGLVRGGRTRDAATLIVLVDTTTEIWARRYRVAADGVVSSDAFPLRGTAAPVDVAPDGSDLVVDYNVGPAGEPRLDIWEWPGGSPPTIHRVPLVGVPGLASPAVADVQAARASDGRVAVFMAQPTSFAIVIVDAELSAVEAVGTHRGAPGERLGITVTRRMFVGWGSDFLLTTEHGSFPDAHSELWSVSSTGVVARVAALQPGLFARDMAAGADGGALIVAARLSDGYEPPPPDGTVQREAETWLMRLDPSGCLRGESQFAYRGSTTAFAVSALGAGAAVLGLRNPGIDETKFEVSLLCALPD